MLVALFAAVGVAQGGAANAVVPLIKALVVVVATLGFAVAINDISDEAIDRVNLPDGAGRPLVQGGTSREMVIVAGTSAMVALAASCSLAAPAILVVLGGLVFTAAYSLRPVRIAERGVVAPLLLPLGYVAVPYLVGIFAVRANITANDLLLMVGLYAGFIGRIVLKDFRDVRGDTMFGKRTFLVRHGRVPTCILSAVFLVAGVAVLPFVRSLTVALALTYVAMVAATLWLLRLLARSTNPRRDAALIAAIAIVGRGMLVTLYAHFAVVAAGWGMAAGSALVGSIAVVSIGSAVEMVRSGGPMTTLVVPADLVTAVLDTAAPVS
jgi:4-hydroxybenzoate polyprenyltransferase